VFAVELAGDEGVGLRLEQVGTEGLIALEVPAG